MQLECRFAQVSDALAIFVGRGRTIPHGRDQAQPALLGGLATPQPERVSDLTPRCTVTPGAVDEVELLNVEPGPRGRDRPQIS